ncbi:hypothetical protein BMF94_4278 [Rhodotorula taiwanensis]|uniref:Origin recognition complex subunit 5 C-terminal domain-containing protein n=1 Tax=Rhodotorula taiwanensis TaxID=741276 RepID=A0A2S5B6P8_9BASI|nr:hypothetical protein BMF94_4278 [Rhodotorula taiwanensis]
MTRQNAVAVPPLPSLAPFLAQLGSLVSSPFCPPSLFLHDPRQSPILVEAILQLLDACQASEIPARDEGEAPQVGDLLPTVARLDLAQVHSVKQALDHSLAQFSGSELAAQSTARWDDRTLGVRAWDATPLEALCVVKEAPSLSKKRGGDASASSKRKRRRMRRGEASVSDESGEEARSDDDQAGDEPTGTGEAACPTSGWTLSWDLSQSEVGEEPARSVAPLRNSLDAFHEALRTIFAFADAHTSPIDKDRLPRRRFIILEHGELLGELAGAGKASGAARETGVGVTFASTIHRLAELTGLPVTVITVSRLPWRKLRESMVGLPSPETLVFEDVSSEDVVALLTARFAASQAEVASKEGTLSDSETVQLFRSLAFIVRTTFGKVVTELDDFAYLTAKFWPRWKAVREQSNPPIAPTDVARLSIALKSDFAAEFDRIFLPRATLTAVAPPPRPSAPGVAAAQQDPLTPTASQPVGFTGRIAALPRQPSFLAPVSESPAAGTARPPTNQLDGPDSFFSSAASSATPSPVKRTASMAVDPFAAAAAGPVPSPRLVAASSVRLGTTQPSSHVALAKSLPLAARYLLIAAYFAAHNPPKSDVRMFVRVDELEGAPQKGKKAKRGGGSAKKMGRSPSKAASATSLSGGKSFAFERMMAIFDSIVDSRLEYALGTVSIAAQVNTLVQLRLLQRVSSENNADKVLDGVKLRCGLARDTVDALAVSVGWREWKERLVGEQA